MKALVLSALGLGAIVYTAFAAFLYWNQNDLVFFPSTGIVSDPLKIGLAFEDLYIDTADGERLHAWYVPRADARGVVLFLHGNAGNISHRLDSIRLFHDLGLETLIIDYRGYGRSSGRPSEHGTYEDARAAWRYLTEQRGIEPHRVVVFGRSLGGAVAAWLAAEVRPAALILESTFTSLPELGQHHYPWLPVRLLSRMRYPSQARLADVRCPVLIVHSRDDRIVPFEHGARLYESARPPKQFLEINGSHNDGFLRSGARYRSSLDAFLTTQLSS